MDEGRHPEPPVGLVLCGGLSIRMGRDKGSLVIHGETQAEHVWKLLRTVCAEVFLSVRPGQAEGSPWEHLPRIEDSCPGAGPMAGILAGQLRFPGSPLLVAAVDMPDLDGSMLRTLLSLRDPRKAATVPCRAGSALEPLFAIYEPGALRALADAFSRGVSGIRAVLETLECNRVPMEIIGDPGNLNTREELLVRASGGRSTAGGGYGKGVE